MKACIPADVADKYCEKLSDSLEQMHEAVRNQDELNRRRQTLRESHKDTGAQFNSDDYVMVSVSSNQTNKRRHNKIMVKR